MPSTQFTMKQILTGVNKLGFGGWLYPLASFHKLQKGLGKALEAFHSKMNQDPDFPLIVTFQGGTGTGKSTFFNALVGIPLSRTGVERPQTRGAILFLNRQVVARFQDTFPFSSFPHQRVSLDDPGLHLEGIPHTVLMVEHDLPSWKDLILIDSPDLDSVEAANRELAQDILLVSDLVIFVTSQEKYGDRIPFRFIQQAQEQGKPYFILINKLESPQGLKDLKDKLREFGLRPRGEVLGFARVDQDQPHLDQGQLELLKQALQGLNRTEVLDSSRAALKAHCRTLLEAISVRMLEEAELHRRLLDRIQGLTREAQSRLEQRLSAGLDQEAQRQIKKQIRKLLARYDFLRGPRNWLRDLLRLPFNLVRLGRKKPGQADPDTPRFAPKHLHLDPLYEAHAFLQHSIATYMAQEEPLSAIYARMTREGLFFSKEELKNRYMREHESIERWLRQRFLEMRKGLSRPKEVGLYSASLLSGLLLVAVESVIGGGISFFELMLDTAIAPFIPKGVLEIFIYDQLKSIGRELDRRHRRALTGILEQQRGLLGKFLEEHMIGSADVAFLTQVREWLDS